MNTETVTGDTQLKTSTIMCTVCHIHEMRYIIMNTNTQNVQNTLTVADKKTLASNIKVDANNKIVCSIATISDAILNLEKSKDKADYGISVLVNTLANIDNDVFKSLDISYTDKEGKTITVDNWTKYCKYRFDYSQSHCSKLKRVADKFFTLTNSDNFLALKANDNEYINTDKDSKLAIVANTNCVNVLKDAFGFPFNISQLQELLTYSVEDITDAIEKCLITSASKTTSGVDSIRNVMKANYGTQTTNDNTDDTNDNTDGTDDNNNDVNTTTYNVEDNDTSRYNTIVSLINAIEDETFKTNDFTVKFVKYINAVIANNKK